MDVLEAIRNRRSIRKYSQRPVEEEKLEAVLEAGRLAPSSNNRQQWKFVVVRDEKKIAQLAEAAGGQKQVAEAPVVLVVCAIGHHVMTCGQPADTVDSSIALSFMMLEAQEQGLGTCWLGFFYDDRVKKILEVPDKMSVVAMTPLGYPAEEPEARPRKSKKEVVSYDLFH